MDCLTFTEDRSTFSKHSNALAQDLKDEHPLDMFNMGLQDYVEASMEYSEGSVGDITILTKMKYDEMKHWHSRLSF